MYLIQILIKEINLINNLNMGRKIENIRKNIMSLLMMIIINLKLLVLKAVKIIMKTIELHLAKNYRVQLMVKKDK